jgi:hypothetical protein
VKTSSELRGLLSDNESKIYKITNLERQISQIRVRNVLRLRELREARELEEEKKEQ